MVAIEAAQRKKHLRVDSAATNEDREKEQERVFHMDDSSRLATNEQSSPL
jgi:hypothetical protein